MLVFSLGLKTKIFGLGLESQVLVPVLALALALTLLALLTHEQGIYILCLNNDNCMLLQCCHPFPSFICLVTYVWKRMHTQQAQR
jgi:hypothetical protein